MKKLVSLLLCVLMVAGFTSCGSNPAKEPATPPSSDLGHTETLQLVSGYGETWEYGDGSYLPCVKVGYPYIHIAGDDEEAYQRMNLVLEELYEIKRTNKLDFLHESKADAKQNFSENPDYFYPYESTEQAFVRRADTKVLSILHNGYTYTGGAHGFPYYWGESYDVATGELLSLSDVVTKKDGLSDLIWKELSEVYLDEIWNGEADLDDWIEAEDVISWTLDYNGITFYFNPYDLAAYAYGRQQITLTFSEYPDLVKEEYQVAPESYGVELPGECNFYYDVNSDGVADALSWTTHGDFEKELTVTLNSIDYKFDHYSFDTEATFLASRDGGCYLYVQTAVENDYNYTYFYRLGDDVEYLGEMAGGMRYYSHGAEDMYFTEAVLSNPDSFEMCTRTQMASTVTGYRTYSVGENGMPKSEQPFYSFEEDGMLTFTALRDFSAEIYHGETHTAKGTVQILAGETMQYYATDNERYIWLLLEDGTLCRKEVVFDDHLPTVDGYRIDEMFEGVMYAG